MVKEFNKEELTEKAHLVRESILRMSANGGAFTGASLSCADIILFLFNNFNRINENPADPYDKDYFFLSKGHAVPALYAVFAEIGLLEKDRLDNHLKSNDYIYWHPNVQIPGVDFHSGSLGHGLPVAVGVAIDMKISGSDKRSIVMTGDGELNEGSNWEAIMIAASKKLDNLVLIIDRNKFQANQETENLIPLEPLDEKFRTFGWEVSMIDGHDFEDIKEAFDKLPLASGKPNVIIANTTRGKGVPSIENKWNKWYCMFDESELSELITELKQNN